MDLNSASKTLKISWDKYQPKYCYPIFDSLILSAVIPQILLVLVTISTYKFSFANTPDYKDVVFEGLRIEMLRTLKFSLQILFIIATMLSMYQYFYGSAWNKKLNAISSYVLNLAWLATFSFSVAEIFSFNHITCETKDTAEVCGINWGFDYKALDMTTYVFIINYFFVYCTYNMKLKFDFFVKFGFFLICVKIFALETLQKHYFSVLVEKLLIYRNDTGSTFEYELHLYYQCQEFLLIFNKVIVLGIIFSYFLAMFLNKYSKQCIEAILVRMPLKWNNNLSDEELEMCEIMAEFHISYEYPDKAMLKAWNEITHEELKEMHPYYRKKIQMKMFERLVLKNCHDEEKKIQILKKAYHLPDYEHLGMFMPIKGGWFQKCLEIFVRFALIFCIGYVVHYEDDYPKYYNIGHNIEYFFYSFVIFLAIDTLVYMGFMCCRLAENGCLTTFARFIQCITYGQSFMLLISYQFGGLIHDMINKYKYEEEANSKNVERIVTISIFNPLHMIVPLAVVKIAMVYFKKSQTISVPLGIIPMVVLLTMYKVSLHFFTLQHEHINEIYTVDSSAEIINLCIEAVFYIFFFIIILGSYNVVIGYTNRLLKAPTPDPNIYSDYQAYAKRAVNISRNHKRIGMYLVQKEFVALISCYLYYHVFLRHYMKQNARIQPNQKYDFYYFMMYLGIYHLILIWDCYFKDQKVNIKKLNILGVCKTCCICMYYCSLINRLINIVQNLNGVDDSIWFHVEFFSVSDYNHRMNLFVNFMVYGYGTVVLFYYYIWDNSFKRYRDYFFVLANFLFVCCLNNCQNHIAFWKIFKLWRFFILHFVLQTVVFWLLWIVKKLLWEWLVPGRAHLVLQSIIRFCLRHMRPVGVWIFNRKSVDYVEIGKGWFFNKWIHFGFNCLYALASLSNFGLKFSNIFSGKNRQENEMLLTNIVDLTLNLFWSIMGIILIFKSKKSYKRQNLNRMQNMVFFWTFLFNTSVNQCFLMNFIHYRKISVFNLGHWDTCIFFIRNCMIIFPAIFEWNFAELGKRWVGLFAYVCFFVIICKNFIYRFDLDDHSNTSQEALSLIGRFIINTSFSYIILYILGITTNGIIISGLQESYKKKIFRNENKLLTILASYMIQLEIKRICVTEIIEDYYQHLDFVELINIEIHINSDFGTYELLTHTNKIHHVVQMAKELSLKGLLKDEDEIQSVLNYEKDSNIVDIEILNYFDVFLSKKYQNVKFDKWKETFDNERSQRFSYEKKILSNIEELGLTSDEIFLLDKNTAKL